MNPNSTRSDGNLRLRDIHRIIAENRGECDFVYDLERTFVIEVPEHLKREIAAGLKPDALSPAAQEWLIGENLLTAAPRRDWSQGALPVLPQLTDISMDMSGACNLGCGYCFENDINSRIGPMAEETALDTLDFFFAKAPKTPRLALHFGSGEPLLRFDLLRKIVAEATRRATQRGQEISFELTTNATLVTPEIAGFFRDNPFNIRVSCDGPPNIQNQHRPYLSGRDSYPAVERGLRLLLDQLPERLTVNSVIVKGTRLIDLWNWAKNFGFRHYHVIKVGTYQKDKLDLHRAELKTFRSDLELICDDIFTDLAAGRVPLDYQPITKIIRRLMIPEPITRFCGVAGSYLGVGSNGKVYPCFRHLGIERYDLGDVWQGVDDERRREFLGREAADVDNRPVCQDCWARYLCGGGCYADSTVYGPEKLEPQTQHCPFWRTEIETAIKFYQRILATDSGYCFRLFGDDPDQILDSLDGEAGFLKRRNCA